MEPKWLAAMIALACVLLAIVVAWICYVVINAITKEERIVSSLEDDRRQLTKYREELEEQKSEESDSRMLYEWLLGNVHYSKGKTTEARRGANQETSVNELRLSKALLKIDRQAVFYTEKDIVRTESRIAQRTSRLEELHAKREHRSRPAHRMAS